MKLKSIYTVIALSALSAGMASCGDGLSDYIPPALHPRAEQTDPEPAEPEFTPHVDGEAYDTYKGLIMCGYQGWFGTPGDGSALTNNENEAWYHYRESGQFRPGVLRNSIDFWPDMSEYTQRYTPGDVYYDKEGYGNASPFLLPDGSRAQVFSSYDESTVLLHFKWMKDYGIDGVFMQRFVGEIQDARHKDHFDTVLRHAMKGSDQYQRAIAVMYDLSGVTYAAGMNSMLRDAQELYDQYGKTQKYYLHENGKPLLALWGVGFNDNGHPSASFVKEYVEKLQEMGWAIMLGLPAYWREGGNDATPGTEHLALLELLKTIDVCMPWYVGRYGYDNFNDTWKNRIGDDIAWAKANEVGYAVHVFPGGSDLNMHPNNGMSKNADGTYQMTDMTTGWRYGGRFYWAQLANAVKKGANSIYVGMFDEIDEGTAIFKQLRVKDVPSNQYAGDDYWVTYKNSNYSITAAQDASATWSVLASQLGVPFQGIDDDQPTDLYLWLTGQASQMLNKKIGFTEDMPTR